MNGMMCDLTCKYVCILTLLFSDHMMYQEEEEEDEESLTEKKTQLEEELAGVHKTLVFLQGNSHVYIPRIQ